MQKRIAILGSTGSIGTQALDVVREQPERFAVELLSCGNNVDLLIQQALEFSPNAVVIGDAAKLEAVKDVLFPKGIKVYAGAEGWRPSRRASTSPWPTRRPWWWPVSW